jgi:regulator of sigma E protease
VTLLGGVTASTTGVNAKYIEGAPELMVISVLPETPAGLAGIVSGDVITSVSANDESITEVTGDSLIAFIAEHPSEELTLSIKRDNTTLFETLTPNIDDNGVAKIGISMEMVGKVQLPFFRAFGEGMKATVFTTGQIMKGIVGLFTGGTDLASVTGPVGIAGIVGDAAKVGIAQLLSLTAIISLNLAVINLVPFPALDGGRILFVAIETITRRPVPTKVFVWANTIGFFLLIGLMILITVRDVIHLF